MTPFDRSTRAIAIRSAARGIVGVCNDVQIMICAKAARVITQVCADLEQLPQEELVKLTEWMMAQPK